MQSIRYTWSKVKVTCSSFKWFTALYCQNLWIRNHISELRKKNLTNESQRIFQWKIQEVKFFVNLPVKFKLTIFWQIQSKFHFLLQINISAAQSGRNMGMTLHKKVWESFHRRTLSCTWCKPHWRQEAGQSISCVIEKITVPYNNSHGTLCT